MNRRKIVVLFGGCSTEYEVSLQSAYTIIKHINQDFYEAIPIGITKEGTWSLYSGVLNKIMENTWMNDKTCVPAMISPNKCDHGIFILYPEHIEKIRVDAIFPVLHGKNGEDGTVQGLCELAGIPIIGCNTLCSALCMDKNKAHSIVQSSGIEVPKSVILKEYLNENILYEKIKYLKMPLFVKPIKSGSSFGITKVQKKEELLQAVELAFTHDNEVIIEENVEGFEVGCAIFGNHELIIGEIDEIELSQGFFDYTEKYTLKSSKIHMPARIPENMAKRIKKAAFTIYRVLGCSGFARVDIFLKADGTIVFNEVNTIPGFTSHSRYPNMLKGIGMKFEEIIEQIIRTAIDNE
ncbi:MAG TPA: D-alanine--D-serine ligase VanG [Clostridium sp.]|nr:D-alanine--D-serine ligase VanG [Clostridium sp.]